MDSEFAQSPNRRKRWPAGFREEVGSSPPQVNVHGGVISSAVIELLTVNGCSGSFPLSPVNVDCRREIGGSGSFGENRKMYFRTAPVVGAEP